MYKYRFFNDYSEGAHPTILELIAQTNLDQEDGYGNDTLSQQAEALLKTAGGNPAAAVHFVSGGTQANLIALASMLKPYQSVIAPRTAHIHVHEAGALESTGHKINTVDTPDGKLSADQVQSVVDQHTDEHMVKPKVVSISNSTEMGTVYTRVDLAEISAVCRKNGLYLYMDGARLGSALTSQGSDVSLPDLSQWVDMLYIGGTKNGALLGEAIVINNPELQTDFRYHLKQRGALLAKGRILGAQFIGLFRDGLYFRLAQRANLLASKLTQALKEQGFSFVTASTTNQIFPIFPNRLIDELQKLYGFYTWSPVDAGHASVRLVTSWATPEEKVDEFIEDVKNELRLF